MNAVIVAEGIQIIKTPVRAPRTNAAEERFVGTVRRECLDWLLIFGRRHLQAVLVEYLHHYDTHRPHRSLQQRSQRSVTDPTLPITNVDVARLRRADILGGLIYEYRLVA